MKLGIGTFQAEKLMSNKLIDQKSIMEVFNPICFIEEHARNGFKNFEITGDINLLYYDDFSNQLIEELAKLKNEYKLTYSVHMPFRGVELSYPNRQIGYAYAELMAKIIRELEPICPEVYIVHPFGDLGKRFGKLGADSFFIKYLSKFSSRALEKILDRTGISPRRIAVENVKFPFNVLDDTIHKLDLSVCMDVGHIIAGYCGEYSMEDFLYKYFDRIEEIHLHDAYNRSTPEGVKIKNHIALGTGDIDYNWLINELNTLGYKKRIILEMGLKDAITSFKRLNVEFPGIFNG